MTIEQIALSVFVDQRFTKMGSIGIRVIFILGLAAAGLIPVSSTQSQNTTAPNDAQLEFFEAKIRPVLVQHCYECHSRTADQVQGGLRLDTRQGMRNGGDSGPAIVPGKPDESLLLEALDYESFEMPPQGRLPASILDDFRNWIADGAADPRTDSEGNANHAANALDDAAGRNHWSFQPVAAPPVPETRNRSWPINSIDRFVLAQLESRGLQPARPATGTELVRRIYFDLLGLPPTPRQIDDFVNDQHPQAWNRLVDQLLDSVHFGERWGRHWLDVARYSDSSGGGRVLIFHDAWRYRDYVIRSMNEDKPFDQFVREQVAGDLLPAQDYRQKSEQLTATGFLMLGPHNYELQDKELLRMEVVDEQIDVIGKGLLGLTLACARCHDHKFDPVPTEDYYALAGIFRSTDSLVNANVSRFVETELPLPDHQQRQIDENRDRQAELTSSIDRLRKQIAEQAKDLTPSHDGVSSKHQLVDDHQATFAGQWRTGHSVAPYIGQGYQYSNQTNASATFEFAIQETGPFEVFLAYTPHPNRSPKVRVKILASGDQTESLIDQRKPPSGHGPFHRLAQIKLDRPGKMVVEVHSDGGGYAVVDAVLLRSINEPEPNPGESPLAGDPNDPLSSYLQDTQKLTRLQQRLGELKKQIPTPIKVMSVREHKSTGDYFVCIRGDVHRLGDQVARGALGILPHRQLSIAPGASGRLELAQWLSDHHNPLTARVYVNRVWSHLFGHGLVRTPNNFGLMGQPPSHPELLDHLTQAFIKNGWSTKWLVRTVVHSRTYQLSTAGTEANDQMDPENRLLWRAHRRRLDVEAIRDAILCFSGQLDSTVGGPSVDRGLKREFGFQYKTTRRSVYIPVFRNTIYDMFDVFDFPNPNLVSGHRNESTLPAQALYLMNSPFVLRHAKAAAQRLLEEDCETDHQRLILAFRRSLGRPPTVDETRLMLTFLEQATLADEHDGESSTAHRSTKKQLDAWTDICHTLIASLDFRYLN